MAGNFEGIKTRNFGIEIEMTGLTRCQAAKAIAKVLDGTAHHEGGSYDKYTVNDEQGREWSIVYDGSNRVLSEKGFSYGKNDFNIYDLTNWANRVYIRLKELFETIEDIDDERFKKVLTDNLIVEEGLSAELICNFSMEIQVDYNDTDDISNFADYIMDLDEEHHSFYFQIQTELDKESYTKGINENTGKLYDLLKRNENDSSKMTIINHLTDIYSAHLMAL